MRLRNSFKLAWQVMILLLCSMHLAYAVEPPREPLLRIDPGEHTAMIVRIATDNAGRWLVTASHDKTARVWNLSDGRLHAILRLPIGGGNEGKLYSVALSPDGQIVAVGGWTMLGSPEGGNAIYLFDRASGRLLHRLTRLPSAINHLAFSPDGRYLAATLGGNGGLHLFVVADGRKVGEDIDYGDDSYSVHFSAGTAGSPAMRLVTTCRDGLLRLYRFDGASLKLLAKRPAPGGKSPFIARFSPDGDHIAVGFVDTPAINLLGGNDLSFIYAPDTADVNMSLGGVAWSLDGATLYAGGLAQRNGQNYIRSWSNMGRKMLADWSVTENVIMDLAALPHGRLAFGSGDPAWGVVNANGTREIYHAPAVADFRNTQASFGLSADGTRVRFSYEQWGKAPAVFDSLSRDFLPADTAGLNLPLIRVPGLEVSDWINSYAPKLNGGVLKLEPYETSQSLAMFPSGSGFVLGTVWNLGAIDRNGKPYWIFPAPSAVWSVNISQDGRWVVAAIGDGTIRWYRATDGVEQLAFYPHPDRKRWVMWTPSGYYDASPGAEELIGWHLNRGRDNAADFFPASRFRKQFYRPDVLTKVFETQNEAMALAQANEESGRRAQTVSIAQVLPPVVEILSPNEGASVSAPSVTLRYDTRSPNDAPVTGIRVRVNGLAVTPLDARSPAVTGGNIGREVDVPIPAHDSEIQLFAENRNGISVPATLRVIWAGKKPAASAEQDSHFKPKLYVLAVGVSKYLNPDFNLGLAAKDATDFANAFMKQKGKLYGDVVVRLLIDDKATKDDVLDGLEWLKSQVTSRDVGVMFLAGHGMNDNTGKYFFMPHNASPDKLLRTGVAQGDIKDTLNTLAGKALFFVDTCHAGNALGTARTRAVEGVTDAFINELASAENGVIVFSSSTGRQLSQEDPKWGNGAFTKAVVEGLNGKAEIGKSGKITLKGLDYYVTERVKELTRGQQSPVSITPGGITDFPIAVTAK